MATPKAKRSKNKTPQTAAEIRRSTVLYDRRDILKKVPRLRKIKSGCK
jgi:hypothetical protein